MTKTNSHSDTPMATEPQVKLNLEQKEDKAAAAALFFVRKALPIVQNAQESVNFATLSTSYEILGDVVKKLKEVEQILIGDVQTDVVTVLYQGEEL